MDPRPNKKGGFRRYQSDLGKEKFHKRGLLGLKEKRQKKRKTKKCPKEILARKEKKKKKRRPRKEA